MHANHSNECAGLRQYGCEHMTPACSLQSLQHQSVAAGGAPKEQEVPAATLYL